MPGETSRRPGANMRTPRRKAGAENEPCTSALGDEHTTSHPPCRPLLTNEIRIRIRNDFLFSTTTKKPHCITPLQHIDLNLNPADSNRIKSFHLKM